jgi:hypothetical protein
MEAKIDIRKLQLLNDRLVQAIDALNQVRMSVYGTAPTQGFGGGLSHTGAYPTMGGGYPGVQQQFGGGIPWLQQGAMGGPGFQTQGPGVFGQNLPQQGFGYGGLSHTPADYNEQQRAGDLYRIAQTFPLLGHWLAQSFPNVGGQWQQQQGPHYPVNPTW